MKVRKIVFLKKKTNFNLLKNAIFKQIRNTVSLFYVQYFICSEFQIILPFNFFDDPEPEEVAVDVVQVVVVVLFDLEVVDGANVRKKNGYINLYLYYKYIDFGRKFKFNEVITFITCSLSSCCYPTAGCFNILNSC